MISFSYFTPSYDQLENANNDARILTFSRFPMFRYLFETYFLFIVELVGIICVTTSRHPFEPQVCGQNTC